MLEVREIKTGELYNYGGGYKHPPTPLDGEPELDDNVDGEQGDMGPRFKVNRVPASHFSHLIHKLRYHEISLGSQDEIVGPLATTVFCTFLCKQKISHMLFFGIRLAKKAKNNITCTEGTLIARVSGSNLFLM